MPFLFAQNAVSFLFGQSEAQTGQDTKMSVATHNLVTVINGMDPEHTLTLEDTQYCLVQNLENFLGFEDESLALVIVYLVSPGDNITKSKLLEFRSNVLEKDDVFHPDFFQNIVFYGAQKSEVTVEPDALKQLNAWQTKGQSFLAGGSKSTVAHGPYVALHGKTWQPWRCTLDILDTPVAGLEGRVIVPSRCYFRPSKERPLDGARISVKDNIDIAGHTTTLCNRSWAQFHSPASENAACVQKILNKGGIIVGKVKLQAMIMREEPLECVEFTAPFNPRADGYQVPSGSSHGSAVGVSSYEWLDYSFGSDTNGSGRKPAQYNGCFSVRPSTGILDTSGVIGQFPQFDMPVFFGRDLSKFPTFISAWYGDSPMLRAPVKKAVTVLYPLDYLPTPNAAQSSLIDRFVCGLEASLGIKRTEISLTDRWKTDLPDGPGHPDIAKYLELAGGYPYYRDSYWALEDFRKGYQSKYGKPPFIHRAMRWQWDVSEKISVEERNMYWRRSEIYREWLLEKVFKDNDTNSITVMVFPIEVGKPNYRDSEPPPMAILPGFASLNMAPMMRGPELTTILGAIPYESAVTKREEPLPIAASVIGAPGADLYLADIVEGGMRSGSFPTCVQTGRQVSKEPHGWGGWNTADTPNRPDFTNLHQYLKSSQTIPGVRVLTSRPSSADLTESFVVIHDLSTGSGSCFGATDTAEFRTSAHTENEPSLVFIRGFAPAHWLNLVGEIYGIHPEMYRRHLQYEAFTLGTQNHYASPSLPSSSARVFQLRIPSICVRNIAGTPYQPEDLHQSRRKQSESLSRYFKQLRGMAQTGDSVVRSFMLLSENHCIIEQVVSVEVGPPAQNWRCVVWLDNGRDLRHGVQGPWCPSPGTRPWETHYLPVIVHPPTRTTPVDHAQSSSDTLSVTSSLQRKAQKVLSGTSNSREWHADQNACLLPFQYGSHLDKQLVQQDALYSLSELFQFAGSAEVQFLNLMHDHIDHELSFVGDERFVMQRDLSLLNLKYIRTHLARHAQGLEETVSIVKNHESFGWPSVQGTSLLKNRVVSMLLTDFEYLLKRTQALAKECDEGMGILANSSVLDESRRSTSNAMRVEKLTFLATVFIPVTFTCTVWGMNFKELGTGTQPWWMWFLVAGPVLLFTLAVYHYKLLIRYFTRITSLLRSSG
ncbi:amidase signature enzyme [Apiospora sp. TS-2023a]